MDACLLKREFIREESGLYDGALKIEPYDGLDEIGFMPSSEFVPEPDGRTVILFGKVTMYFCIFQNMPRYLLGYRDIEADRLNVIRHPDKVHICVRLVCLVPYGPCRRQSYGFFVCFPRYVVNVNPVYCSHQLKRYFIHFFSEDNQGVLHHVIDIDIWTVHQGEQVQIVRDE